MAESLPFKNAAATFLRDERAHEVALQKFRAAEETLREAAKFREQSRAALLDERYLKRVDDNERIIAIGHTLLRIRRTGFDARLEVYLEQLEMIDEQGREV